MNHVIRPKYWPQQVVMLLPTLVADDVLVINSAGSYASRAIRMVFAEWGVSKVEVVTVTPACPTRCLRCGSNVYGDFCETCPTGTLHKQTCGQLWRGIAPGSNVDYLVNKGLTASPDTPCNCGGEELEHSIQHAKNDLRL